MNAKTHGGNRRPNFVRRTIELPEAVDKLLVAAAARRRKDRMGRQLTVEGLMARMLIGDTTRGSIDAALERYGLYVSDVHARFGNEFDAKVSDTQSASLA